MCNFLCVLSVQISHLEKFNLASGTKTILLCQRSNMFISCKAIEMFKICCACSAVPKVIAITCLLLPAFSNHCPKVGWNWSQSAETWKYASRSVEYCIALQSALHCTAECTALHCTKLQCITALNCTVSVRGRDDG